LSPSVQVIQIPISIERVYNNGDDFVSYFNAQASIIGANILLSYSQNSHKLILTNNNNVPIRLVSSYRFSDSLTGPSDSMDKLGFTDNYIGSSIASNTSYTAPSILKLLRSNCYFLTANIVGASVRQSIVPSPFFTPQIIARITANTFGTLSQLQYASTMSFYVPDNIITSIKFQILDDQLYPIDLNNLPITFALKFIIE
jgi:hypothetical protein